MKPNSKLYLYKKVSCIFVLLLILSSSMFFLTSGTKQTQTPASPLPEKLPQEQPAINDPVIANLSLASQESSSVLYLSFDINPEFQIGIDKSGKIVNMQAYNYDGEQIIAQFNKENSIDTTLTQLISLLIQKEYLAPSKSDNFLLFCSYGEKNQEAQFDDLVEHTLSVLSENKIQCEVWSQFFSDNASLLASAEYQGVSFGKMAFLYHVEQTIEGFSATDNIKEPVSGVWGRTYLNGTQTKYGTVTGGYHFAVGEVDEFGELVLYGAGPEKETSRGYVPFDQLSKEYQDQMYELYDEDNVALMKEPRKWVTVPNVIGMSAAQAKQVMNSRGLIIRFAYNDQGIDTYPEGYCYYQDVAAGGRWNTDASIILYIYKKSPAPSSSASPIPPAASPSPTVIPSPSPAVSQEPLPSAAEEPQS